MVLWWNVSEPFGKLSPKTMKFNLEKVLCGTLCCFIYWAPTFARQRSIFHVWAVTQNFLTLSTTFTSESSIVDDKSSSSFFLRQRPSHKTFLVFTANCSEITFSPTQATLLHLNSQLNPLTKRREINFPVANKFSTPWTS